METERPTPRLDFDYDLVKYMNTSKGSGGRFMVRVPQLQE